MNDRTVLVWLCALAAVPLLLSGCGHGAANQKTATPTPRVASPTPGQGGIASGSASGAQGAAPAAAPARAVPSPGSFGPPNPDGTCPASLPVKIDHEAHAHAPGSAGYDAVKPTACYATLAAAQANGYLPATRASLPAPSP